MEQFTNYCTEEQTKRALKLNASLEKVIEQDGREVIYTLPEDDEHWSDCDAYYIPTTQQMIGWLDSLNICINVRATDEYWYYFVTKGLKVTHSDGNLKSRYEAELNAIDAALDYLEKGETK